MSDNLMEKVSAFGERLKITGAEVSRKMSAGMSSMSFKLRELLEDQNTATTTTQATAAAAERMVEEATTSLESKSVEGEEEEEEVKWSLNLHICDLINDKRIDSGEIIRSIKKWMALSSSRTQPRVEYLCMVLLEMLVNNCDKAVSDQMTSEGVIDELVKLSHHPNTVSRNRDKALLLIKEWRESCCQLQYLLYTHQQTYKRLQSRRVTDDSSNMKGSSSKPISADQSDSVKNLEMLLNDQYDHNKHDQIHVADQTNTYNSKLVLKEKQIRKQVLDVARNSIDLLSTVISSSSPYMHDPSEEELATAVVEQCRRSQYEVQRMIANKGDDDDDALMFEEALNVNDHLHDILTKYEHQLRRRIGRNHYKPPPAADDPQSSLAATSPDHHNQPQSSSSYNKSNLDQQVVDADLDEMIFGTK